MPKTSTPRIITKKHLARLERERIQNRYIVIGASVILFAVIALVGYGVLDQTVLLNRRAVAQVGATKLTMGEFRKQVQIRRTQLIQQYLQTKQFMSFFADDPQNTQYFQQSLDQITQQLNDPVTMGDQVVDSMVTEELIRQEAAKRGINVTEEEIDTALQENFGYFPLGTPTPTITPTVGATSTLSSLQMTLVPPTRTPTVTTTPTESALTPTGSITTTPSATPEPSTPTPTGPTTTPTPQPTSTPYTLEGYRQQVKNYLAQYTEFEFTERDLRRLVESSLYYEKVREAITVEVKPVQEQVWARHILVADETAAQVVYERVIDGEDFATVAAEVSTDESNKNSGGDLGWFAKGKMVAEFEQVAFAIEVGEISEPVKSEFGYHIIQILGHENRPLSESEYNSLKDEAFNQWLEEMKAGEQVNKFDNWQDYVPTTPVLAASDL